MSAPTLVAVGLVRHGEDASGEPRYVVTRRPPGTHLAGFWELPGGKIHDDETPEEALCRELREELGVGIEPPAPITFSYHLYEDRTVLLLFFRARTVEDSPPPRPTTAEELRLVTLEELRQLRFPPANAPLLEALGPHAREGV